MESRTSIQLQQLLPGDLLLFRPSIQSWFMQQIIMLVQAFMSHKHGHYDTTHVAICIGHDENQLPRIAHVTEKHEHMGYIEENLMEMFDRDDGDRPFLVFRPHDKQTADKIANIAGNPENHTKNMYWKLSKGIKSLLTNRKIKPEVEAPLLRSHSRSTICSQFAIESIKLAVNGKNLEDDIVHEYPDIHSTSTPKVLEGYLYRSRSYQKLVYLGKNGFDGLASEIENQIERIGERRDAKSRAKYAKAKVEFQMAVCVINKNPDWNEMQKSLFILKRLLPVFYKTTGVGFFSTTSFSSVMNCARKMGIFERDIRNFVTTYLPR